ncbi:hypothetical protein BDR06DRAFT_330608 [Suillus hirtellus]|nr:hypothetical protein BDR06DRAFT_330608 [Suillus hirtellus]
MSGQRVAASGDPECIKDTNLKHSRKKSFLDITWRQPVLSLATLIPGACCIFLLPCGSSNVACTIRTSTGLHLFFMSERRCVLSGKLECHSHQGQTNQLIISYL